MSPRLFPSDVHEFFKANNYGRTAKEMTELLNRTFATSYTPEQIKNYRSRNHWVSGLTGYFEKGYTPHNKGKKGISYPGTEATQFKKGNTPHNHRPVGSVRVDSDGFVYKKIAEPNKWRQLHILNWEAVHGPVPEGCVVVFKDQDRLNCEIDNLMLLTRGEHAVMCKQRLYSSIPEATETGLLIAQLIKAGAKAKRKRKKANT